MSATLHECSATDSASRTPRWTHPARLSALSFPARAMRSTHARADGAADYGEGMFGRRSRERGKLLRLNLVPFVGMRR